MKKLLSAAFLFLVGISLPSLLFVQGTAAPATPEPLFKGVIPAPDGPGSLGQKIKDGSIHMADIPAVLIHIIDLVTLLAGTVAVIFLLYGGIQFIFSGLTEDKEAAKNTIKWAIIGLIITFSAWIVVNLIQVQLTG